MTASIPHHPPRFDFYGPIHKTLRMLMSRTLVRIGSIDAHDDADREDVLAEVDALLDLCRIHVEHENHHVHPMVEAAQANASAKIAGEHEDHLVEIDGLATAVAMLRAAPEAERDRLANALYHRFVAFVAHNFEHMAYEERVHQPLLWARYTDAELLAAERAIIADTPPAQGALVASSMLAAVNGTERIGLLAGMRAGMPPELFEVMVDDARRRLPPRAWANTARALGLPVQPGLMTA